MATGVPGEAGAGREFRHVGTRTASLHCSGSGSPKNSHGVLEFMDDAQQISILQDTLSLLKVYFGDVPLREDLQERKVTRATGVARHPS